MPPTEIVTPPSPPTLIERIERHPYFAVALIVIIVVVIGIVVVLQRAGVSDTQNGMTWASPSIFLGGGSAARGTSANPIQTTPLNPERTELPPIPLPTSPYTEGEAAFSGSLNDLLALLSPPAAIGTASTASTESPYSFIPQGQIALTTETRTSSVNENMLHTYGNEVGTLIQSFEAMHGNMAQVLKDHAEDRTNPEKTKALSQMGFEYAELGYGLSKIETVPESAKSAHAAYATTYRIVGTNLKKVSETSTDESYLDAIEVYNASVEELTKRFIALVGVFTINNVKFSSSEPGSVFMFNANLSL